MGIFPKDPDGTFHIPFWVWITIKFIPGKAGMFVKMLLELIDQMPAPGKANLADALRQARVTGDDTKLTGALHEAATQRRDRDLVR